MELENAAETEHSKPLISKEKLKAILCAHKLWLDTKGNEGIQADMSGTNLKGAVFISSNLQRTSITAIE